ncbi:MAG: hypothetical protein ABI446_03615 [Gemmatimonadaceae bacterium]
MPNKSAIRVPKVKAAASALAPREDRRVLRTKRALVSRSSSSTRATMRSYGWD